MKRVLLVDDNQAITRSIRAALTRSTNYTIRAVNDSREAYAAALEFEPNVIVMDINMPHKDGPAVAADLRTDRRTMDIPIVFLSAICTQDDQVLSRGRPGRDLMMAKPFQLKTFLSVIRELLQPAVYPAGMLMARQGC